MGKKKTIQIYNRSTDRIEPEVVLGEGFVRILYQNFLGRLLWAPLLKHRVFSRLFGWYQDRPSSAARIPKVVARLGIDLSEAEKDLEDFSSFNDFFTRSLKKESRPIDSSPSVVVSPCDARLLAYPFLDDKTPFDIKGCPFSLDRLLADRDLALRYAGGTFWVYRLCPADYHRFHFPEACVPQPAVTLDGSLHSVNPIALGSGYRILDTNFRQRTLLEADGRPGIIAMVEIGAMCVGSIVQTFVAGVKVERGQEKGMFRFGGSTVVVLYEPHTVQIDEDILLYSSKGVETLVKLGMAVGSYLD